jgi:hypothetical protein
MRDFAHPLPALVIADMLAVDPDDQDDFIRWADDIAALIGNPHSSFDTALQAQASLVALTGYFRALLSERRRDRGGDLALLHGGSIISPATPNAHTLSAIGNAGACSSGSSQYSALLNYITYDPALLYL